MQRRNSSTDICGHCSQPFADGESRYVLAGNQPYHAHCINAALSPEGKIAALEKRVAVLEQKMRAVLPERDPMD